MTATGRPETAGLPDRETQTGQSDLMLKVSKVASISATWAPATGHKRASLRTARRTSSA